MKTLDVSVLQSSIIEISKSLDLQNSELEQLNTAITDFLSMKDSFEGKGGDAIRSFFEECHIPFITYYRNALQDYKEQLLKSKSALQAMEPSSSGYISENFLQNELEDGIRKAKEVTVDLTMDANKVIQSIQDIVNLPKLDESEFINQSKKADTERELTIEKLNEYDTHNSSSLDAVNQDIDSMDQYVQQIQGLFKSKEINISAYQSGSLLEKLSNTDVNSTSRYKASVLDSISAGNRAAIVLTSFEERQARIDSNKGTPDEDKFLTALKDGALGALAPVAIMTGLHKSGLLRVEFTKKKNHIAIKYDKKALKYLKGQKGPKWLINIVKSINSISGQNASIVKQKKQLKKDLKRGVKNVPKYKDTRTAAQKIRGFVVGKVTKNMQIKDFLQSKLIKFSDGAALIPVDKYKSIASKAAGKAGFIGEALVGASDIWNRTSKNSHLKGVKKYEANGRVVGEEVNEIVGAGVGASTGAYVGAAIGGVVSGPFAPIGMAVGGAVGGAVGASVGKWAASKATKKWMGDTGEAVGKATHSIGKKASNAFNSLGKTLGWG